MFDTELVHAAVQAFVQGLEQFWDLNDGAREDHVQCAGNNSHRPMNYLQELVQKGGLAS